MASMVAPVGVMSQAPASYRPEQSMFLKSFKRKLQSGRSAHSFYCYLPTTVHGRCASGASHQCYVPKHASLCNWAVTLASVPVDTTHPIPMENSY